MPNAKVIQIKFTCTLVDYAENLAMQQIRIIRENATFTSLLHKIQWYFQQNVVKLVKVKTGDQQKIPKVQVS